jgi:hypothetical protein
MPLQIRPVTRGGHAGPVTMGRIARGPLSWTRPHCGMPSSPVFVWCRSSEGCPCLLCLSVQWLSSGDFERRVAFLPSLQHRPYVDLLHWSFFPRPMKGWPYDLLGPWAFREVFYPFSGHGGYLSPTAGGKVNRQAARTRWTVAHTHWTVDHSAWEGESPDRAYPSYGGTTLHSEYLNHFSTTSSGKVFFGPSTFQSLRVFFTGRARYKKRSGTVKGLLLGVCFVAEGPIRIKTFGRSTQKQSWSCQSKSFVAYY